MMIRRSTCLSLALVATLAAGACDSKDDDLIGKTAPPGVGNAGAAGESSGGSSAAGASGSGGASTAGGGSNEASNPGIAGGLSGAAGRSSSDGASGGADSTPSNADAGPDGSAAVEGTLTFFFVDSEGGQSTVAQLPNGQVLVIDTGNPGMRDGERMLAVLQGELGATEIDYLLTTHYDSDHVGGVTYLAARLGVGQFFDHGAANAPANYLALANAGTRRVLAAGDVVELGGVVLHVVSAAGTVIDTPLAGGGAPNPLCEGAQAALPGDAIDENVNSVGVVLRFGRFDFLDLGDLLWPREHELACPNNRIGPVDLYLTTHHGTTRSGAPQLVRAIQPLAAVMNNGPRKGGGGTTWNTLALAPGGEDVWQLHRAVTAPDTQNAPPDQIANLDEGQADEANYLKVTVDGSGQFSVQNPRTSFSKTYTAR
ncbi:MAG TPA: MBL fold metallo-hydrolase [Polyangiaceae bacterium]|nr:MBL fold metallo-hydrolase [Polyangiaceae bacterium]